MGWICRQCIIASDDHYVKQPPLRIHRPLRKRLCCRCPVVSDRSVAALLCQCHCPQVAALRLSVSTVSPLRVRLVPGDWGRLGRGSVGYVARECLLAWAELSGRGRYPIREAMPVTGHILRPSMTVRKPPPLLASPRLPENLSALWNACVSRVRDFSTTQI